MIRLHHLNKSRSKRIIWLLEELGVDYEIKSYQRDAQTRLAPAELRAVHPLGKSPVIEDGDLTVAESGAITEYLAATYGADTLVPQPGTVEYVDYIQWLHFAEGTAAFPLIATFILSADNSQDCKLGEYSTRNMIANLGYVNQLLESRTYLVGEQFTAADILNAFVFEAVAASVGLDHFPKLAEYLERIKSRPAAQKADALEKQYDAEEA
ncbi:glutathione S-transferase family protein [Pseudomaricurvus alkylphenolicus]|uniref:glutathione S-transferase family protein n=1 Tax=Pseudomaricurvus alkylphenolicus TaxID=1306991 RepID=UPI0014240DCC|nr:glutathione S-transferase family protein [Pseudomaricurvus alkylphenolicus]NIB41634.1 glutathione S-transferase family protein [Pseudomaricurvus alkylphenolicus]